MAGPLKQLINAESLAFLASQLEKHLTGFDKSQFQQQVLSKLALLSLTQRVRLVADAIECQVSEDFSKVGPQLLIIAENWPGSKNTNGWQHYIAWPLIQYAGKAGLKMPDLALSVLAGLSPLFTAEFAVRPYLDIHFETTYQKMLLWTKSNDLHVRRLASEGLRPRLPWGKRLNHIPLGKALALLDKLKDDDSRYVQKSVANHLNDLSKDHPEHILDLCKRWQIDATRSRQWIIRRALRTLQKQADPNALTLLGYPPDLSLGVSFELAETGCRIGDQITLQLTIDNLSNQPQTLLVDYELWFIRANGLLSAKVFFWQRLILLGKQQVNLKKQQVMQQLRTRKLYPGEHRICLRINGQQQSIRPFMLRS